ncbi:hypothetical protein [Donghicola mangrovi]|uniref:Uncharacterized protein n=1 Tax=Donghicola mangrovi TaxID=2729614 RepID=A0A850Q4X4_9RHOB|nr:hypothetical protein [Donghicola mangrovi]NVO23132.1 hypothetical protein [Donghicola mangrovi]
MTCVRHSAIFDLIQVSIDSLLESELHLNDGARRNLCGQKYDFAIQILQDLSVVFRETSQLNFHFCDEFAENLKLELVYSKISDLPLPTKGSTVQLF